MAIKMVNNIRNDTINVDLPIIGRMAKDVISGFSGIITHVSFNIEGITQVVIESDIQATATGFNQGTWFNISRVVLIGEDNVLDNCHTLKNKFEFNISKENE